MTGFDCSGTATTSSGLTAVPPRTWQHPMGKLSVDVATAPFALVVKDATGKVLLESSPAHDGAAPEDALRAYAPLALTHNEDLSVPTPMKGWDSYRGQDDPWAHATNVSSFEDDATA